MKRPYSTYEEHEEYSKKRFKLGKKFKLSKSWAGLPVGLEGVVILDWPNTRIKFDVYKKYLAVPDVHWDLDECLEEVKGD